MSEFSTAEVPRIQGSISVVSAIQARHNSRPSGSGRVSSEGCQRDSRTRTAAEALWRKL